MSASKEDIQLWFGVAMSVCFLISETLPFIRSNNYNGLIHFLALKLQLCAAVPQAAPAAQQGAQHLHHTVSLSISKDDDEEQQRASSSDRAKK